MTLARVHLVHLVVRGESKLGLFGRKDKKDNQDWQAQFTTAQLETTAGNWKKADELLQSGLAAAEAASVCDEQRVPLLSLGAVAAVRMQDLKRGIALAKKAVELREKLGTVDDALIGDMSNVGSFMRLNNENREAHPIMERSIELRKRLHGSDDRMAVRMTIYLAQNLIDMQSYDQAVALMNTLFDTCHKLGYIDEQVEAIQSLADTMQEHKRFQELEALCKSEVEWLGRQLGPHHPALSVPTLSLGRCYLAMGNTEEAENWLNISYNMRRKLLGPDHVMTARAGQNLGILYMAQGNGAASITLFDEALKIAKQNKDVQLAIGVIANYSSCLSAMGRTQEANRLRAEAQKMQGL